MAAMIQRPVDRLISRGIVVAFLLMGSDARAHSLAEHAGDRGVVLAWFPKAFTGG